MRIFAPVIVRGEEEKGVRLWEFGKEVYQDFLNMATDDEIGDYTDIVAGRDYNAMTSVQDVLQKNTSGRVTDFKKDQAETMFKEKKDV